MPASRVSRNKQAVQENQLSHNAHAGERIQINPYLNFNGTCEEAFRFDGAVIMGSDAPEGYYSKPQGNYLSINVDKPADARRIFEALAEKGDVHMPFEKTFWAAGGFGMAADRFGTPWMVNCEKSD